MHIDPANKCFLTVFILVIFGTIGFFVSSIFLDFSGDVIVQEIKFENSKFHFDIKRLKDDKRYVIQVFSGKNSIVLLNRQGMGKYELLTSTQESELNLP